jgi:hypothetical protein
LLAGTGEKGHQLRAQRLVEQGVEFFHDLPFRCPKCGLISG